ncbi:hypothetical protein OEA41_000504 [Lepraria neglecta]|uniref:Uncharacterized protein n=1 Tax=Lepraria neglecta TaxID=209136 RepID=A0AAD9ZGC6_9LECA|nr:hypothetical protein OEA41_000504 [Lepraria neglecta]
MSNGSNLDHYYRIHTKSNDPDVERYLLENERLSTFDYTLGYPFPNPWCYWRKGERNDQSDYPDDMAIRHYIPRSLFNYYYARKGGLILAKDWARDSKDLVAVDKLITRCTVETIPEDKGYLRPVEWDRGFWGQDGRIIMGETKGKSGEFKALDGPPEVEYREMIVSSAPPPSASRPILKPHPPKRAGLAAPGPSERWSWTWSRGESSWFRLFGHKI